jgi:cytochrome P450
MTISNEEVFVTKTRRPSVSSIPPFVPLGEEHAWCQELASGVMARCRGVASEPSFVSRVAHSAGQALLRLAAPVIGVIAGAWLGVFLAPFTLVLSISWPKRLLVFLLAPLAGPLAGGFFGLRFAASGKVIDLPQIAGLLHKHSPFIALPEAIRHHLFGLVLVARHADVRTVLERNDVFRVDMYDDRMRATTGAFFLGADPGGAYDTEQPMGADVFGRSVETLQKFTGELCRELVNQAMRRPSKTIDVVGELAQVVPIAVLREYFGIQDTPDERLRTWLQATGFFIFNFWIGGVYRVRAADAGAHLSEHLRQVVSLRDDKRRAGEELRSDVLSRMLLKFAPTKDRVLADKDRDFIVRTLGGLISGTTVPTIGLSVGVIDRLLDLPDSALHDLRKAAQTGNDERVTQYVREAGRFSTYPPMLYRHAAMAYEFDPGGKHQTTAQRGALVVTAPFLANFDPAVFSDPKTFNPSRADLKQTMLFGWDRHRCLGEYVGQMMMVEMVKALFAHPIRRLAGPAGRLQNGKRGVIPDGDFYSRLVARLG